MSKLVAKLILEGTPLTWKTAGPPRNGSGKLNGYLAATGRQRLDSR